MDQLDGHLTSWSTQRWFLGAFVL